MRPRPDRRVRGTTIYDLLVAIGITAIVLSLAVPRLRAFAAPYELDTASRLVASELMVARMRAVAQNRRHRVAFDDEAGTWALQAETSPGVFATVGPTRSLPDGVDFGTVATDPVFDTRGMLASSISIAMSGMSGTRTVAVNVLGNTQISHTVAASAGTGSGTPLLDGEPVLADGGTL